MILPDILPDIRYVIGGIVVTAISIVANHLYAKRKEVLVLKRPILTELYELLTDVESEVKSYGSDIKTRIREANYYLSRSSPSTLPNINSCGGPFPWNGVESAIKQIDVFLETKVQHNLTFQKEVLELQEVKNLLNKLRTLLEDFNRHWPHGQDIKKLEHINKSNFSESKELAGIKSLTTQTEGRVKELQNKIDKSLRIKDWWKLW